VIIGVPAQEKGIRPARALPYELNVQASVNASNSTVGLNFFNTGGATVVFQVRSDNPADLVRQYTVEPGKTLPDTWDVASSYNLSVYGPNGFVRYFNGSIGSSAAALDVRSSYGSAAVVAAQSKGKSPMSPPTTPKLVYSMPIQAT
jgi:phospholipase C